MCGSRPLPKRPHEIGTLVPARRDLSQPGWGGGIQTRTQVTSIKITERGDSVLCTRNLGPPQPNSQHVTDASDVNRPCETANNQLRFGHGRLLNYYQVQAKLVS